MADRGNPPNEGKGNEMTAESNTPPPTPASSADSPRTTLCRHLKSQKADAVSSGREEGDPRVAPFRSAHPLLCSGVLFCFSPVLLMGQDISLCALVNRFSINQELILCEST